MLHRVLLAFCAVLVLALPADAGTCNVTEFPSTGTLTADRLNTRIRQTEACVNGNIGNGNWNSSEKLTTANMASPNVVFSTSWTIGDENLDAVAGEIVTAENGIRNWQIPVSGTVIGMTVSLRCTAADCTGAAATVTLQEDANTIKSFTGLATQKTPATDFTLSTAITNTDVLNLDIAGTLTRVEFIDITIYYKAVLQS